MDIKLSRKLRKKNIVLFGANDFCKYIIDNFEEYNFLGIWDTSITTMHLYGLRILQEDEVVFLRTEILVLTQRLSYWKESFREIITFCQQNDIRLLDVFGYDYTDKLERWKNQRFSFTTSNLKNKVVNYDVLSFDIFDTLIMRKVFKPEDVFLIVEKKAADKGIYFKKFAEMRVKAQLESGLNNPDIYKIYDQIQLMTGISERDKDTVLALEIETEKEVLVPRRSMVEVFEYAIKMGKIVCLISDMYIPRNILKDILDQCGIKGYKDIFVSCDYKRLKLEGLFDEYRKKITGEYYLHFGDNLIYDGYCANFSGIEAIVIPSAIDILNQFNGFQKKALKYSLEERVLAGLAVSKIFNDPFCVNAEREIKLSSLYDFSYAVIGPLMISFMTWFINESEREEYDAILFSARDGFLIKKLYELMRGKSDRKTLYFLTSRKAAVATISDQEAIIQLFINSSLNLRPHKILRERFCLPFEKILSYDEDRYKGDIGKYIWDHKEAICENAILMRKNYFKYMGNMGLKIGKRYLFFDFVSSGTCQKALTKIVPFELEGIYFAFDLEHNDEKLPVKSFMSFDDTYFMRNYKFVEAILSSYKPSLWGFDVNGKPLYCPENRSQDELIKLKEIHSGIIDCVKDYYNINIGVGKADIPKEFWEGFFNLKDYIKWEKEVPLTLVDDWIGEKIQVNV